MGLESDTCTRQQGNSEDEILSRLAALTGTPFAMLSQLLKEAQAQGELSELEVGGVWVLSSVSLWSCERCGTCNKTRCLEGVQLDYYGWQVRELVKFELESHRAGCKVLYRHWHPGSNEGLSCSNATRTFGQRPGKASDTSAVLLAYLANSLVRPLCFNNLQGTLEPRPWAFPVGSVSFHYLFLFVVVLL